MCYSGGPLVDIRGPIFLGSAPSLSRLGNKSVRSMTLAARCPLIGHSRFGKTGSLTARSLGIRGSVSIARSLGIRGSVSPLFGSALPAVVDPRDRRAAVLLRDRRSRLFARNGVGSQ